MLFIKEIINFLTAPYCLITCSRDPADCFAEISS